MTERAIELLRQHQRLAELAAFTFNFDLRRADHDEERLLARIGGTQEEMRSSYTPELDTERAELRAGPGFEERSPVELIARLHGALPRTEPGHVLLSANELPAYELLDPRVRTPLRETVLAPGRADLVRMRSDRAAWGGRGRGAPGYSSRLRPGPRPARRGAAKR